MSRTRRRRRQVVAGVAGGKARGVRGRPGVAARRAGRRGRQARPVGGQTKTEQRYVKRRTASSTRGRCGQRGRRRRPAGNIVSGSTRGAGLGTDHAFVPAARVDRKRRYNKRPQKTRNAVFRRTGNQGQRGGPRGRKRGRANESNVAAIARRDQNLRSSFRELVADRFPQGPASSQIGVPGRKDY